MFSLKQILDKLNPDVESITLNAKKLGKLIKGQKIKSRYTLTEDENWYYASGLKELYRNWGFYGDRGWTVEEKTPNPRFTVIFRRK